MFINSNVNPYQNFANYSFAKNENIESKKDDKITIETTLQTPKQNTEQKTSYASEFGFRTDENGIFEKDLNKAARIPLEYDINIKSIREISKQLTKLDENLSYNKIDLPKLLNTYHNTLKTINKEFQNNEIYLNKTQITQLNQGYSYNSEGKILKIYENFDDINNAKKENKNLNILMLNNSISDFNFKSSIENTANNAFIKPYLNQNSDVSKSGLLLNYIYNDLKTQNQNKANFFLSPLELDISFNQTFQKLINQELNAEDFIKENNKEKISFDLYLYMNGIDKNNTSEDKLSVFFQQYINYQHSVNIQEFANSSSIYNTYIQESSKKLQDSIDSFNENNAKFDLEKINSQKDFLNTEFLEKRKKQASINKILYSYLNAMA